MLYRSFLTALHLSKDNPPAAELNRVRLEKLKEVFGFSDQEVMLWDAEAQVMIKTIEQLLASLDGPDPNTRH